MSRSLLLALPAAAGAAGSKYPSASAARGFDGGAAGWDSSSSTEGTCLAPLLCASVENSFQGSGGADGGGYIRSAYTGVVGATAVGGTTTAVWQSPPFTYSGPAETSPGRSASRSTAAPTSTSCLPWPATRPNTRCGSSTSRRVARALTLIAPTTLAGAAPGPTCSGGSIDPGSLTIGDEYRIQITSRYTSGTSVLVTGSADYDNVVLSAADGNGGGKGNGGDGDGSWKRRRRASARSGWRNCCAGRRRAPRVLDGNKRLLVRVKCPRKVGRHCRTTAQGLLRKGRPATAKRTSACAAARAAWSRLRVKPKARTAGGEAQAPAGPPESPRRQGDGDGLQDPPADPALNSLPLARIRICPDAGGKCGYDGRGPC